MNNFFLLLGIKLLWYNLIDYPKVWQKSTGFNRKITCHKYLNDTEKQLYIFKALSMSGETFTQILKYISITQCASLYRLVQAGFIFYNAGTK